MDSRVRGNDVLRKGFQLCLILVTCFCITFNVALADLQLNASVDRSEVPLNETFTYSVEVKGDKDVGNLNIPDIAGFEKLGSSQSTQIQFINGSVSRAKTFQFMLKPTKQGTFRIPSFRFAADGQSFQTEPIQVTVTAPSVASAQQNEPSNQPVDPFDLFRSQVFNRRVRQFPNQDMDLRLEVRPSKTSVYVGDKFLSTLKIYYDRSFMQNPQITLPEFKGFIVQISENKFEHGEEDLSGKHFNSETMIKTLSGLKPGKIALGTLNLVYQDNPYAGAKQKASPAVTVTVLPLPLPQPAGFSGAVGTFTVKGPTFKNTTVKAFDSIPLNVEISGEGNLDRVQGLDLQLGSGVRFYLDGVTSDDHSSGARILTSKTFKYFLIPEQAGDISPKPIQFTYFDPHSAQYQTLNIALPNFHVLASSGTQTLTTEVSSAASENVIQINLKSDQFTRFKKYIVPGIFGFLGLAGLWGLWQALMKLRGRRIRLLRLRLEKLSQLGNKDQWAKNAYELLIDAVTYKWNVNLRGFTLGAIKLSLPQVPEQATEKIIHALSELEAQRFAPDLQGQERDQIVSVIGECLR